MKDEILSFILRQDKCKIMNKWLFFSEYLFPCWSEENLFYDFKVISSYDD
jgi:hypothetical protein